VVVTIMRKEAKKPIDFELVRDTIPITSVKSIKLKSGYGYARLSNFTSTTTTELVEALEKFESDKDPLNGLILDLRNNGGGLLDQSIKVSDLFIDEGTILSIKGRHKRNTKVFSAHKNGTIGNYPIVVLINGGSASASEIVAGALQDHKRALIIGTTSFGKGSVQTVEKLRDGSGLKLTIARYFTPNGTSIQAKGIKPNIFLEYKPLDENEKGPSKRVRLREKDLKNHLDALPRDKKEKKKPGEKKKKEESPDPEKEKMLEINYRIGPLTIEKLERDNQVMRALEILVGYNTFKHLENK